MSEAYRKAVEADEAFSVELARVYGKAGCNMRYRPSLFTDERLIASSNAKREADQAMHATWRKSGDQK
jgi:hypothetical protein